MYKNIEFIAWNEEVFENIPPPIPASSCVPDWYKKSFKYQESNKVSFYENSNTPKFTIKGCMPVFDAMTMGYLQLSWTDIYVEKEKDSIICRYASGPEILSTRDQKIKQHLPTPPGFLDVMYDWKRYWVPKTPIGYSCLYTSPMYHYDLPFTTIPGVVDTDSWVGVGLNSPSFFIKSDFEGLIPKGTPLYQIIPFKRENWKKSVEYKKYKKLLEKNQKNLQTKLFDNYKKLFWIRKNYV